MKIAEAKKNLRAALTEIERITFDPMLRNRTGHLQSGAIGAIQTIIRNTREDEPEVARRDDGADEIIKLYAARDSAAKELGILRLSVRRLAEVLGVNGDPPLIIPEQTVERGWNRLIAAICDRIEHPASIFVVMVDHRHGTWVGAAHTAEGAREVLAGYVEGEWINHPPSEGEMPIDTEAAIAQYFDTHEDESYVIEETMIAHETPIIESVPVVVIAEAASTSDFVSARVHSDDYHVEFEFNAATWLRQAAPDEIIGLAQIEWGGDYEADEVAQFYRAGTTKRLFDYLDTSPTMGNGDTVGFECHVDEDQAMTWLRANRPEVAEAITKC